MQDIIDEACEAVQATAAGKSRAAIRRMLTEEAEMGLRPAHPAPPPASVAASRSCSRAASAQIRAAAITAWSYRQ